MTRTGRHRASATGSVVGRSRAERAGQGATGGLADDPFDGPARPPRPTTGGRILSVRVSREEAQAFDVAMEAAGFSSRSEALRSLVRGAGGAVAPLPEETELLGGMARELHKIGVNVNQIALAANRRQIALMRDEWDEIGQLRKLLPELRLAIGRLIVLRRRAGLAALGGASEGPATTRATGTGADMGTGKEIGNA